MLKNVIEVCLVVINMEGKMSPQNWGMANVSYSPANWRHVPYKINRQIKETKDLY